MATTLEVLNITNDTGVELGRGAAASGANSIAIGASEGSPTSGAILTGASATAAGAIAIGISAKATAAGAVQIGAGTNASANTVQFQGTHLVTDVKYNEIIAYLANGMFQHGTLVISGTAATRAKTTTTTIYTIAGVNYALAATDAAGMAFTAAGTISLGSKWGAWIFQVNAAGTVSTKSFPAGTGNQEYATEAAAIAALPAPDASNVQIGYVTVQSIAGEAWTALTSTLTASNASGGCQARNFYNLPAVKTLPAAI